MARVKETTPPIVHHRSSTTHLSSDHEQSWDRRHAVTEEGYWLSEEVRARYFLVSYAMDPFFSRGRWMDGISTRTGVKPR